jgi:hypothetical protein
MKTWCVTLYINFSFRNSPLLFFISKCVGTGEAFVLDARDTYASPHANKARVNVPYWENNKCFFDCALPALLCSWMFQKVIGAGAEGVRFGEIPPADSWPPHLKTYYQNFVVRNFNPSGSPSPLEIAKIMLTAGDPFVREILIRNKLTTETNFKYEDGRPMNSINDLLPIVFDTNDQDFSTRGFFEGVSFNCDTHGKVAKAVALKYLNVVVSDDNNFSHIVFPVVSLDHFDLVLNVERIDNESKSLGDGSDFKVCKQLERAQNTGSAAMAEPRSSRSKKTPTEAIVVTADDASNFESAQAARVRENPGTVVYCSKALNRMVESSSTGVLTVTPPTATLILYWDKNNPSFFDQQHVDHSYSHQAELSLKFEVPVEFFLNGQEFPRRSLFHKNIYELTGILFRRGPGHFTSSFLVLDEGHIASGTGVDYSNTTWHYYEDLHVRARINSGLTPTYTCPGVNNPFHHARSAASEADIPDASKQLRVLFLIYSFISSHWDPLAGCQTQHN